MPHTERLRKSNHSWNKRHDTMWSLACSSRKVSDCCFLAFLLVEVGKGCVVQKGMPLTTDAQLTATTQSTTEQDMLVLTTTSPASTEVYPNQNIVRADLGATVKFSCDPVVSDGSVKFAALARITWSHQNVLIHCNTTAPLTVTWFYYSHARTAHSVHLFIHNVTSDSGGTVKCHQMCRTNQNGSCLVRQYEFIPRVRAKDVFPDRMENATAKDGDLSITCRAAVYCPSGPDQYFIWKFGDVFLAAPTGHYFREKYGLQKLPLGVFRLHVSSGYSGTGATGRVCEASLKIGASQFFPPPTAPVECWVRVHHMSDEWLIQRAYAHFPWRGPDLDFRINKD